jgi:ketosteroid isomerase-like protein
MLDVDEAIVLKAIQDFFAVYSVGDAGAVMALMSRDPDSVVVGTGADEIRIGPEQIRAQVERDLGQAEHLAMQLGDVRVSGRGDVAWAMAEPLVIATVGGEPIRMPTRLTVTLVNDGGRWLIHSLHLSVAFAGQQSGESFPTA